MITNEYEIFRELNRRLAEAGIDLKVICVGGFVLSHYGLRATQDIDGFFQTNDQIEDIIYDVGQQFGVNTRDESWLNNSVNNMNEIPSEEYCDKLYEFSNLTILMVPLEYIAGMKLQSAREQDLQDVGAIIAKQNIQTPEDMTEILSSYSFPAPDESLLLEAFANAYGMDWLREYFERDEERLITVLSR